MNILAILRLGDAKAPDHLIPLLESPTVRRLFLVRHAPVDIRSDKLVQVIHDAGLGRGAAGQQTAAQLKNLWLCFFNGLRVARRERPDAIVAFNFVPYGVIAWLVARLGGSRTVASLIGSDYNRHLRSRWYGPLLWAVLRGCDRVTVFGEEARAGLVQRGLPPDRVFVLPHTVNTEVFKSGPGSPDVDLIYVGNLNRLKRVDLVLHALRQVHEKRPGTTLLVVGDGPERQALEALAEELGLRQAVRFHGWSQRVVDQLWRARVFVSLSEAEGLPMAILEALCTGLPVVVTDVGAIHTVVRDGENGYLLPSPADPTLAAARILRLLEDAAHYGQLRQAALRARQTHGYTHTTQAWERILAGLR